jgi:hypothetical protein
VTSSEELDIDWDGRSIQQVQKVRGTKVGVMIRMLKSGRFAKRRPKSPKLTRALRMKMRPTASRPASKR